MRRVAREDLEAGTYADLASRQAEADRQRAMGILNVKTFWNTTRASPSFRPVLAALRRMAGETQRCMYCLDSQGTDVEHFYPKSPYPERMVVWTNLLLGCTLCGRLKGDRFPLDADTIPLLIDPTTDNPWEHLDFDADTGNLTARYDAAGVPSPKGAATVSLLQFDRREALQRMYLRNFRRLCDAVESAIAGGAPNPDALVARLRGIDDHGLLGWCFANLGANHETLAKLQSGFPDAWGACAAEFARV